MPKVLYIGYEITGTTKGGALLYQRSVARSLAERGWEVTCFFGVDAFGCRSLPGIKKRFKNGIKYLDFYSRLGAAFRNDMKSQCSQRAVEEITRRIIYEEKPDIVHIHELQMHPAAVIDIIKDAGIPLIKTMHNYYDICPQRDLMQDGTRICNGAGDGAHCPTCLRNPRNPWINLLEDIIFRLVGRRLFSFCLKIYRRIFPRKETKTAKGGKRARDAACTADDVLERNRFFSERINKVDIIHCSSPASARILTDNGIDAERIVVVPISVVHLKEIKAKPLRPDGYPVTFGYMGGNVASRGYHVLVKSFSLLDSSKARLLIYGTFLKGEVESGEKGISKNGYYHIQDINEVLKDIDVGIMPSVWNEIYGLTGLEFIKARIPVIASDIGGIPVWLKNGENGFLARAGDAEDLAAKMEKFTKDTSLIRSLQKKMKPPLDFDEHIGELLSLYKSLLG